MSNLSQATRKGNNSLPWLDVDWGNTVHILQEKNVLWHNTNANSYGVGRNLDTFKFTFIYCFRKNSDLSYGML